jgi:hypothetical protein
MTAPTTLPPINPNSKETMLTPAEVAQRLARLRGGRPVKAWTVITWIRRGVRQPDGTRLKLPAVRCSFKWAVPEASLLAWIAQMTEAHLADPPQVPTARDEKRTRTIGERAGEELAASGW